MPNIGPVELIIVLVIVLVLFGAKRLPEVGRGLGQGMKEFKDSVTGKGGSDEPKELASTSTSSASTSTETEQGPGHVEPQHETVSRGG
jgi:sec-independent protein translocase protein TatA